MFRIEMLPAAHGDCLWIEYGDGTEVHRILIDGGPAHTYQALRDRILYLPADERYFDLLVVTHIDGDHIEGVVRLLQDAAALNCSFGQIWFNGRDQLNSVLDPAGEPLGAVQGEYLGMLISDYEKAAGKPVWNKEFRDGVVTVEPDSESLPVVALPGKCNVTVLSPTHDRLLELKSTWRRELKKAKVTSGDEATLRRKLAANRQLHPLGDVLGAEDDAVQGHFELPDPDGRDLEGGLDDELGGGDGEPRGEAEFGSDSSNANGSSIALLLEFPADSPEVRILLSGDAWASVLETSIERLLPRPDVRLHLDAFKIPHHGSVGNVTKSLLEKISCKHYLVSTSGAKFRHPHMRAINLLLDSHKNRAKPRLHFNYLTETTSPWGSETKQEDEGYVAFLPRGLSLRL